MSFFENLSFWWKNRMQKILWGSIPFLKIKFSNKLNNQHYLDTKVYKWILLLISLQWLFIFFYIVVKDHAIAAMLFSCFFLMVPDKWLDPCHELGQEAFGEMSGLWIVVPQQLIAEIGIDIIYMVTCQVEVYYKKFTPLHAKIIVY